MHIGILLNVLTHKVRQFMCILTRGWNTYCSRPIVVQVGHLVRQSLQFVNVPSSMVVNNYVMSGIHRPLSDMLTNQKKIYPVKQKKSWSFNFFYCIRLHSWFKNLIAWRNSIIFTNHVWLLCDLSQFLAVGSGMSNLVSSSAVNNINT